MICMISPKLAIFELGARQLNHHSNAPQQVSGTTWVLLLTIPLFFGLLDIFGRPNHNATEDLVAV